MCTTSLCLDRGTRASLLAQARKGDRESLAKLILPYTPGLYLGALRLTRNPADAEDVRQDTFLKAMTRLDRRDPQAARRETVLARRADRCGRRNAGKQRDGVPGQSRRTLRAARNAQVDGRRDHPTGSGSPPGVPVARCLRVLDPRSCRATGDFGNGGASEAFPSAPETPGKTEYCVAAS